MFFGTLAEYCRLSNLFRQSLEIRIVLPDLFKSFG
jgi:hypothetical protein